MFKMKDVVEQERTRIVTEAFSGIGVVGRPGEVWRISAGVPMPQALEQNSAPHEGPVPYEVVRYDQAAHDVYVKLNMPRAEPAPPVLLTDEGVCARQGWTMERLRSARATLGFPKPSHSRDTFDGDGVPTGQLGLTRLAAIIDWAANVRTFAPGTR